MSIEQQRTAFGAWADRNPLEYPARTWDAFIEGWTAAIAQDRQSRGEPIGELHPNVSAYGIGKPCLIYPNGYFSHGGVKVYPVAQSAEPTVKHSLTTAEPVKEPSAGCPIPPIGWHCTRVAGHDGPCAAVDAPEEIELVKRGMDRLRAAQPAASAEPVAHQGFDFLEGLVDHSTYLEILAAAKRIYTDPQPAEPVNPDWCDGCNPDNCSTGCGREVIEGRKAAAEPVNGPSADEIQRLWVEVRHQDARTQTGHTLAFARALLASYGNAAQPAVGVKPVRYEVLMGLTPAHRRWEAVSLRDYESVRKSRPNEARALYTAPVAAQSSVPECPFACGWRALHKMAVQDAAYLAKLDWPEDEEGVSVPRATTMRCLDNLIQVCRTMIAPTPPTAEQAQQEDKQ